jgi:hypothetical protein
MTKPKFTINPILIPIFIAAVFTAASYFAWFFRMPTYAETKPELIKSVAAANFKTAEFEVNGVVCLGTSKTFAKWLNELSGILSINTYTSDRFVEVGYDDSKVSADEMIISIEREVSAGGEKLKPFSVIRYRASKGAEWVVLRTNKKVEVDEL